MRTHSLQILTLIFTWEPAPVVRVFCYFGFKGEEWGRQQLDEVQLE